MPRSAVILHDIHGNVCAQSVATRPELQALEPLAARLIQAVEQFGRRVIACGGTRAPWPDSWQREIREHLDGIQSELETAREETDDADARAALDDAEGCVQSLYGEVEKPRPNWTTMRTESRELVRVLQPGVESGIPTVIRTHQARTPGGTHDG